MNTAKLKSYAPQARRDFIAAVEARANLLGLSAKGGKLDIAPCENRGDIVVIAGQAWPAMVHQQRERLIQRIQKDGFAHTVEVVAYTWFNRFAALRYMELHDYLDHGHRVLSSREGGLPEVLAHATDLVGVLPGLSAAQIAELKLAGNQDGELYRLLLVAQCNALASAMPFLFERIDDESELLLPDNLIRTDSLIRSLVDEIPEADWSEIEIIGWLYQFYIAEKKDQVIGKVVASENIPAATQLFTPNWIVKYMVQNSLGAQWLATYPDSPLKAQMAYYIEPAEQTADVRARLAEITPGALDPETLMLIDPACGSGHILVEAYELFKAIYLERGYRQRDVAQLILEKNLFGLDIDERAAQLTAFALMMKGRADDRRLFERGLKLKVMALVDSAGLDVEALANGVKLSDYGLKSEDLLEMTRLFEHATTFGSLIQVPEELAKKLPALKKLCETISQDLFVSEALQHLLPLVQQAELLAEEYDAVVANPPYMGSKGMNTLVKGFAKDYFPDVNSDLFAVSATRFFGLSKPTGFVGLMTPFTWMFLNSYGALRRLLLETKTLHSLIQPEYHAFFDSAYVPVCTFVVQNLYTSGYEASFIKLSDFYGADLQPEKALEAIENPECGWLYKAKPDEFKRIPGSPVAYWVNESTGDCFARGRPLSSLAQLREGLTTGDNERFLRLWSEVSLGTIGFGVKKRANFNSVWAPHNKGGSYRRWYGNHEFVVLWEEDGRDLRASADTALRSQDTYFQPSLSWSRVSSGLFALRSNPFGMTYDSTSPSIFSSPEILAEVISVLNSVVVDHLLKVMSPTLDYRITSLGRIPVVPVRSVDGLEASRRCVLIAREDWNSYERSWDFQSFILLSASSGSNPTSPISTRRRSGPSCAATRLIRTRHLTLGAA